MEQADEKILEQKAAALKFEQQCFSDETIGKENEQSIFDGTIDIHGISVSFSERKLYDGQVGLWLPDDFMEWTPEMVAESYLLGNKPDFVLGNGYLDFFVGFHDTGNRVPDEQMEEFVKLARLMIERSGPKAAIYSQKVCKAGRRTVSSLELVTHAITGAVYNVMFFSSFQNKVLIGFINFNYKYRKRYRPIAKEILKSFHYIESEEESYGNDHT